MASKKNLIISIAVGAMIIGASILFQSFGSNASGDKVQSVSSEKYSGFNIPKTGVEVTKSQDFEDWRFECFKKTGSDGQQCRIFQRLTQQENKKNKKVLTASVVMVKRKMPKKEEVMISPVMRFLTPRNVFLPAGVTMAFNKELKVPVLYQLCSQGGCIAERGIGPKILDTLSKNKSMIVLYQAIGREVPPPIALNVSLKGFSAAFKALAQEATGQVPGAGQVPSKGNK